MKSKKAKKVAGHSILIHITDMEDGENADVRISFWPPLHAKTRHTPAVILGLAALDALKAAGDKP